MSGTLYVVATPIGNLDDLSPRARRTLADVDLIAAEDTRHTGRLLSHFAIKTPQFALHDYNEEEAARTLIGELLAGKSVALVSDAGTPLVSDPGYRLVRAAHERSIKVSPVAGVSAVTAALSAAGLPSDRFCFEGYLPARQKARHDRLSDLASEPRTIVFYESVHRIGDFLRDIVDAFGEHRKAFIGRELTKMHEQCVQAPLGELLQQIGDDRITRKGEFVVVVAGSRAADKLCLDVDRLLIELADQMPAKQAARIVAGATGAKRNALYQRLLDLKNRDNLD